MRIILFLLLLMLPPVMYGQIITTIAGTGAAGHTGDGGPAIYAQLNRPGILKIDAFGNKYVTDEFSHAIRKINAAGIISTIAGTGTAGYTGDGGPATNARLSRPSDIVFDNVDNLYVSEFGNGTIRKITPAGVITTIAGNGAPGYSGENGLATAAQLDDPVGLVFDGSGNLFFSDIKNHRVRKINTSGIITTVAGTGVPGFGGDGGIATAATLFYPGYLVFNLAGELLVPDYMNHRIRKITGTGIINTIYGSSVGGTSGDGGPASAATFGQPSALLYDPAGNLYVSDRANFVIRKINTEGIISTIVGCRIGGFSGDGGLATAAKIELDAVCSAIDDAGDLYIVDANNNRVRKVTYNTGINEHVQENAGINLYPNPTRNEITITSTREIESIEVVSMLGQTIETSPSFGYRSGQAHPKERDVLLNVTHLPAGIYFVKVNGAYAGKFVKE